MQMPGRKYTQPNCSYRYGFNGKEDDNDIEEGAQDYGMRIYDSRLGRFLSVDPIAKDYPWYTPYQFAGNKPIWCIDLDGAEELISTAPIKYRINYKGAHYYDKDYSQNIYSSQLTNPTDASVKQAVISYRADADVNYDGIAKNKKGSTNANKTTFGGIYGRELDASVTPILTIPGGTHREAIEKAGGQVGDLYVSWRMDPNGNSLGTTVGIVGDVGPQGQPGEQSPASNVPKVGVDANDYIYLIFTGSAKYWEDIVGKNENGKIKAIPTVEQLQEAYNKYRADFFPNGNSNTAEVNKAVKNLKQQSRKDSYDNATPSEHKAAMDKLKSLKKKKK